MLPPPVQAGHRFIEYLYINSGEGSASGGHAAIGFDQEVFHFQHVDPGLLRLHRDNFSAFRFNYGYRENRTIAGHRIEVDELAFQTLRDAFNRRFLIQNQQFAGLNSLNEDHELLLALEQLEHFCPEQLPARKVELKALGYFVTEYRLGSGIPAALDVGSGNAHFSQLKPAVQAEYGADFLQYKRQQMLQRLRDLKPSVSGNTVELTVEHFQANEVSFAQRYKNTLLNLAALDVLESGILPRQDTLLTAGLDGLRLDQSAINKLADYRQTLNNDLLKLLRSERYDWGYPLLVGIARLHALQMSIQTGQLVVLERCSSDEEFGNTQIMAAENLPAVIKFTEKSLDIATRHLADAEALDEHGYGEIELAVSSYLKIHNTPKSSAKFVMPLLSNSPDVFARADLVALPMETSELHDSERRIAAQIAVYRRKLQTLYDYQLLSRNCVTEIFQVINDSFRHYLSRQTGTKSLTPESVGQLSRQWLGGYIEDQPLNIVPFVAFDTVADSYRLHSSYNLQPYREQQIENLYQSHSGALVDLAESNILTSTLYHWQGQDAAFLFFTQDAVWPRPLLGSVNLGVALGQMLYGLFALPWDSGENLHMSLKGVFVSVPELFFFNIRKGSFPQLLPDISAAEAEIR